MAVETTYTYTIATDFPAGKIAAGVLDAEIRASAITIALKHILVSGPTCDVLFKDALPAADKTILDGDTVGPSGGLIGAHAGVAAQPVDLVKIDGPVDSDGNNIFAPSLRLGSEFAFATHDLTDPTTWFSKSERVTAAAATDSGDGLTWNLPDSPLIDMTHGLVMDEDTLAQAQVDANPGDPHGYAMKVYVDSVEQTERVPFSATGGDYTVDYTTGTVTFFVAQTGKTVTADYSRGGTVAGSSCYVLKPLTGKMLDIESAEAQFSDPVTYNDTIVFSVYGFVEVFAPLLTPAPYPAGTLIPISTKKYKRLDQIIDEAMGAYPQIPAIGGTGRGNTAPRSGFPFRYGTVRRLISSMGMELRVYLENDQAFVGERATATFYGTSKDEPT